MKTVLPFLLFSVLLVSASHGRGPVLSNNDSLPQFWELDGVPVLLLGGAVGLRLPDDGFRLRWINLSGTRAVADEPAGNSGGAGTVLVRAPDADDHWLAVLVKHL